MLASISPHFPRRSHLKAFVWTLFTCFALAFAAPSTLLAKDKVVVLKFKGPQAKAFENLVGSLIKSSANVVPFKKFQRATKQVKRFKPNPAGYRKVAKRLGVAGFIEGKVVKRGGRFVVTIALRGADGKVIDETVKLTSKRPRLNPRQKRQTRKKLRKALQALSGTESADDDDDEPVDVVDDEPDDDKDDQPADDADDEPEDDKDDEEENPLKERDDEDEGDKDDEDKDSGDTMENLRSPALEASIGPSVSIRNLSFSADTNGTAPQEYEGAAVGGAFVNVDVYPMGFVKGQKGILRNIGLTAMVDRVISISSKAGDATLPTTQMRYGVGVVFRYNLGGDSKNGITIKASARYSSLDFTIDKEGVAEATIPSVSYKFIDPGLSVQVPITDDIDVGASGHFYLMLSTGQIQEEAFYGAAGVSGFDGELFARYKLGSKLMFGLHAGYAAISHDFDGNGVLTDRDTDGTQDVSSASDSYLSGLLTAGYRF